MTRIGIVLLISIGCLGAQTAFDVASVKPSKEPGPPNFPLDGGNAKTAGGRLSARTGLWEFISFAYKLSPYESQTVFAQLPKSVSAGFYEIEARAEGNPTKDQMRLMMQSLLADRFKLKVHFETREAPVFALILVKPGKTGRKLIPHSEGPPCPESFSTPPPGVVVPKAGGAFPANCEVLGGFQVIAEGVLQVGLRDATMQSVAEAIYTAGHWTREADKPVVDETGLGGRFDFIIRFTPALYDRTGESLPDPSGIPFRNALRDQLGLKLKSSRAPIRRIVIDHVEKPAEN